MGCDYSNQKYEYKIVKGAEASYSQEKWDELLARGPLVVAMDASFEGFGQYRPETFEPLQPRSCGGINHAVIAVGRVTENGKEYLIVRNSWGTSWGYKGYFKITRSINCGLTQYGWLPTIDKDGKVPILTPDQDPGPNPKPEPSNKDDVVELFSYEGYASKPIMTANDSVCQLDDYFFYGVRFPKTNKHQLKIMTFPWKNCGGDWRMAVEQDTEFIERNGGTAYSASLAFIKQAKSNCVNFYTERCHKGDAAFMICGDIKDTQLVNFSQLREVKSILADDLAIKRISFHTKPNFE